MQASCGWSFAIVGKESNKIVHTNSSQELQKGTWVKSLVLCNVILQFLLQFYKFIGVRDHIQKCFDNIVERCQALGNTTIAITDEKSSSPQVPLQAQPSSPAGASTPESKAARKNERFRKTFSLPQSESIIKGLTPLLLS